MRSLFAVLFVVFIFSSCTHIVRFQGANFAAPRVAEQSWSGGASIVFSPTINVQLFDDISENPPLRNGISIGGKDAHDLASAMFGGLPLPTFNFDLSFISSVEGYYDSTVYGLRWQLLDVNGWAASIQGGVGGWTFDNEPNKNDGGVTKSNSKIASGQLGASLGYQFAKALPYVSYVQNTYKVDTSVKNEWGDFGPYIDKGAHRHIAIGVTTINTAFLAGIEYNFVDVDWEGVRSWESVFAARLGYQW